MAGPIVTGSNPQSPDGGTPVNITAGNQDRSPFASQNQSAVGSTGGKLQDLLAPGRPLHGKILSRLIVRYALSQRHMAVRYDDWDRVDEHLRLFIDLSRMARRSDKTQDQTKIEMPFDRAIVVPFAYAIHEVRKTQLFGLFAYREPMLQFTSRKPDNIRSAELMESVASYDLEQMQAARVIYSLLNDTEKYGMGVVYDTWESEYGWVDGPPPPPSNPLIATIQKALVGSGMLPPPKPVPTWDCTREYNRWENVDPYNFWPDPRTPVSLIQNAEFIGHRIFRGYSWLLERAQENGGPYFNLSKLKEASGGGLTGAAVPRQMGIQKARFNLDQFQLKEAADEKDKGFFALDHMQIKIVPKDWELPSASGNDNRPEIWWFTVADFNTIIRAHPSPYKHGRFTYSVAESNHDPHSIYNPGMVENMDGLQRFSNWLFNSHVENVRKIINDAIIYDPMLLEESDLLNPGPARHIRLTQTGSQLLQGGTLGIPQMWGQFSISDITAINLKICQFIFDLMQRMSASNDPMMGQQTEEKRTLGEVQSIIAAGSQRIGVTARMIDSMAIMPLAQRMIANRQQFTTMEQWYKVTGNLAKDEAARGGAIFVAPEDLAGDFDYTPIPGTMPTDPARQAQVWMQILQTVSQDPNLQMSPDGTKKLDITQILGEAVRHMGIRNLDDFYISIQPDPAVQQGVQSGNMVPMSAAGPNGNVPGAGIQTPMVAVPGQPGAPPGSPPVGAAPPGTPPQAAPRPQ